jgi:hypothetical protein
VQEQFGAEPCCAVAAERAQFHVEDPSRHGGACAMASARQQGGS